MKGMNKYIRKSSIVILASMPLLWLSCSAGHEGLVANEDDFAQIEVEDLSPMTTRSAPNGMDLESFSLSVFYPRTNKLVANNILHTITETGIQMSGSWRMAPAGEMIAVAVGPSLDYTQNLVLTADEQTFEYTVPPTDQTMIKIGGNLSFTKASTGNKLSLKFVNSLTNFMLRARNEMKVEDENGDQFDVDIIVKSFTLHNIAAKGRFKFTGNYNGTWTLIDDVYADYTQVLETPVTLSKSSFSDIMQDVLVLLPQTPVGWEPAATDAAVEEVDGIAKANTDHKTYIELKCQITTVRDNQTVYLWGSADGVGRDQYQSVYFPYVRKYCPKPWNAINRQGTYNLRFTKNEALDSGGKPIKPQTQDQGDTFENAVFISVAPTDENGDDWVEDWEDPEEVDVTI